MIAPGSPTVRRRRLAAELRGIREDRGKSGDTVAAALKWSPSKISRYERARTGLRPREVARLLDRGYQKFIKTSQYELPASASQLHAIHAFHEELTQLMGGVSLYNESLGTTSDLYEYDRLRGREELQPAPARPWELTGGH